MMEFKKKVFADLHKINMLLYKQAYQLKNIISRKPGYISDRIC